MGFDKGQGRVAGRFPQVGAVFMCNRATKKECFRRQLFGLPAGKADFVVRVKAGMILFLFEYERRELHGVFRASSDGAMDIVPHAYSDSGAQFSAQVRFTTILRCSPLSEAEFSGAIRENYFSPNKFNFGLSERQVEQLLQLFSTRKLQLQLHHRHSPQNEVRRRSLTPYYVSAPPEGAIDGGYSNLGMERYEQNAVHGSGFMRSHKYSESPANYNQRAMDEYANIARGNDLRLNDRSHVPVSPNENVGDLIVSNNVAIERPVHQDNRQSTVQDSRNEINADSVPRLDSRSGYYEPILAADRSTGFRTTGYDPPVSTEQQPVHDSNTIYQRNSLVGDDLQCTSTDRRIGSRAPGYNPPVSSQQHSGRCQYPDPPASDLQYISTGRRTGSIAPGYYPSVASEQHPGASQYSNSPVYDLQHSSTDRRNGSIAPGYDPLVSSEQQPGVSQYPNPAAYGRNSILETNSWVGDDLQGTSIMHRSSPEQRYLPLPPYSALLDLETLPRPSFVNNGPHTAACGRPGTGNISTQPYNPEASSYNGTNHSLPQPRVSSSFPDESLPTLNNATYSPSYANELLRPYRQLKDDSSLFPRYAHSNLSSDNNEASYRSNMLNHSSFSSEYFFPRPSLPPLPLPSENMSGGTTAVGGRSLLAPPVINTSSLSGRWHSVTAPLEGNIPQSGSAHEEVPCNHNSSPNSNRTHDNRRSDYDAYSPVHLYGSQDSGRMHSYQQKRNKCSVFDRLVFPATKGREQGGSSTNFVGDDDDDDKDDFSVSEIMTSLRQSRYRWLNENQPAKFLNERRNNGTQYQVGNNKRRIMPQETKSDDHLADGVVPVEDDDNDDTLVKNEENLPFVDFKRRSSTLRKAHQVEAANTTGSDNVVSAENEQRKRRKLIRPKFGDGT